LYGHIFRNAMLIVIAGFPSAFVGALFTGSLLTEIIFSLDGLGLLGFEAAVNRDYPVMFGTLYFFTLLGLLLNLALAGGGPLGIQGCTTDSAAPHLQLAHWKAVFERLRGQLGEEAETVHPRDGGGGGEDAR